MKKLLTLILILSSFITGYSQSWKDDYNSFLNEFQNQNYKKSIEIGHLTLEKIESELGKKDTNYANTLYYLQYAYFLIEDYKNAVEYAKIERDIRLEVQGKDNLNYITACYDLAIYLTYTGEFSKADIYITEVVETIESQYGKENDNYINIATQQANIYYQGGSYAKADRVYAEVFDIIKKTHSKSDSLYMSFSNSLASFYNATGNYDKAEPFYIDAVEMIEKLYGKLSDTYVTTLNSQGEFYLYAGWYEKAEKVYLEFVEVCKDYYGKKSADYATALNNLAVSYEKQSKYSAAESLYLESLKIKEKVYKKESDYYALTLNNLAVLYDYMGENEKAESLYNQTIDIYKSIYGEENINYATALNNMATLLSNNGKYEKAIDALKKSLEIQKKIYGEKYSGYITSLNNLALIYEEQGQFKLAMTNFRKAAELGREALGKMHPDYATTLYNIANLKMTNGEYEKAEEILLNVIDIREKTVGVDHPDYANTLNSLAGVYSYQGRYRKAEVTYKNCEHIYINQYGDKHPEYATFLNNYGQFFSESGYYSKAEEILNQSLSIQNDAYGENHPNSTYILSNLANVYINQANYKKAEKCLFQSYKIIEEFYGKEHPNLASFLNNLAKYYYEIGDYKKAESLYFSSLEIIKKVYPNDHPEYTNILNNIGSLYMAMAIFSEDENEASAYATQSYDYFIEVLKIDSITIPLDHPDFATHLNNLAELYRNTTNFEKAESLFLKVIEIENKNFGENNANTAISYHNLALTLSAKKDFEKAEKYALKSLEIKKKIYGEKSNSFADTKFTLAYIYEQANQTDKAINAYYAAHKDKYEQLNTNFTFLSEEEKFNYLNSLEHFNDQYNAFALKTKEINKSVVGQSYNNELSNKGMLLKSSTQMRDLILHSNDASLINLYNKWIDLRQQLSALYTIEDDKRTSSIDTLEARVNNLEKQLVDGSAYFKSMKKLIKWHDIRNQLNDDEAAIEFTHFKIFEEYNAIEIYCALILLPNQKEPLMVKLFTSDMLTAIIGKSGRTDYNYISDLYKEKQLYKTIWEPLEKYLEDIATIYFSPSGLLHKISFAAIRDNNNASLIDRFNLIQLSSTAKIRDESKGLIVFNEDKNAILFGGAFYNNDSITKGTWKYLAGTKTESEKINHLFKESDIQSRLYTGNNASEENFKEIAENDSTLIVHIATHGFFYPNPEKQKRNKQIENSDVEFRGSSTSAEMLLQNKNPLMRSGLVLSGANKFWANTKTNGENGVLTAYEVSNMNLRNTKLAVMSACETGLGEIEGSEGVYGLQRAFKMAGVDYILMSLWQVPDKETEEFMIEFYKNLIKNHDIRAAFINTQKMMSEKYDPYFWGAFVLIK